MNRNLLVGVLALALALSAFASGCSHKKPVTDEGAAAASFGDSDLGSSDNGRAMGLQTVRFAFDASTLDAEAKRLLKENAEILKSHGDLHVQIEGHCDARGGIQYNLALGERRAEAVKRLLEDDGVSEAQLATISYGKERPLAPGNDEAAYAQNRRANFAVTAVRR